MSLNQYAVYQLKQDDDTRPFRYKSYKHVLEKHITVISDNYIQVYQTPMIQDTSPEKIREQLEYKLPSNFKGRALNVSDVIAVTKEGVTSAYYVDISGLILIPGFFRMNSSTSMITMETKGFVFDDRKGSWMATDETITDGKQFFLMTIAAVPDRSDSMDHIPGGKPIALCDLCFAGRAAVQGTAFGQQFWPGGPVNGAVDTAAAQQRTIGCVDNGVHIHFGNIISDDFEGHEDSLSFLS